jgi:hypothetical protein
MSGVWTVSVDSVGGLADTERPAYFISGVDWGIRRALRADWIV